MYIICRLPELFFLLHRMVVFSDIMAIHSELSAVSGGESGPESERESMRRPG